MWYLVLLERRKRRGEQRKGERRGKKRSVERRGAPREEGERQGWGGEKSFWVIPEEKDNMCTNGQIILTF
jgi:hypothetical protein